MGQVVNHPAAAKVQTQYLTCAQTAKLIRQALKEAFPTVKFSVRSSVYAGGASIDVAYTDGPQLKAVEAVAFTFQGGYFDGSTDYAGHHLHAINDQPVHFGANYVFVRQSISPAHAAACASAVAALTDLELNHLEFRLRIGEFAGPFHMARDDYAYRLAVQTATLPPIAPLPSPTVASVRHVRSY